MHFFEEEKFNNLINTRTCLIDVQIYQTFSRICLLVFTVIYLKMKNNDFKFWGSMTWNITFEGLL